MSAADIYKEIILDYYKNPRNYGRLSNYTVSFRDSNPLCGDEIEMQLLIKDGKLEQVNFIGRGCAISQASASMLTELAKGKDIEWVRNLSKEQILEMLGNPDLGPARIKCALLGMKVLKQAVYEYLGNKEQ